MFRYFTYCYVGLSHAAHLTTQLRSSQLDEAGSAWQRWRLRSCVVTDHHVLHMCAVADGACAYLWAAAQLSLGFAVTL